MTNTYLKINLKQVQENIKNVSKGKKACLMVKANNYGIGYGIIPEFVKMGYDYFGVSTIQEADIVRSYAPKAEILIVSYVDPVDYQKVIDKNYTITVYDMSTLNSIEQKIKYHLKFDTGMGRIGFFPDEIAQVKAIIDQKQIYPEGIFSHFPEAINQTFTLKQIENFKRIVGEFNDYDFKYVHLQNSVGSQLYNLDFCNMIRPGLSIWGYYADEIEKQFVEEKLGIVIKPTLCLNAKVHMIKNYDGLIGYDLSEKVHGKVGTIRIGYHDGLSRSFNSYVFSTGEKIVGKVCMCQSFVLLPKDIEQLEIFGEHNSIYDLSKYGDITIYELLVSLSNRILREW